MSQGCPATSTREARVIQRLYRASRPAALISLLALPFRCIGARTLLAALLPFLNDLTSHSTLTQLHTLPALRCSLQYLSAGVTTIKGLCATGPGSTPPIANPCQAQKNTTEMTLAAGVIMNSWSCMACADANPCNKIDPIPAPASANAASRASSLATTALITAAGAATALTL